MPAKEEEEEEEEEEKINVDKLYLVQIINSIPSTPCI
jgi:hypothetical protein